MNNVHFENKSVSRHFFWFVWLIYAVVCMTKNCFSAAMASIVFEGVMTKSQTGLITAVFYTVYAPLQAVGGVFADKYDPERLIKIGLIGGGMANLIVFLNHNYYVVLVTWIFNAIVQFALWPSVFKIVSSQIVREDRKDATFYISFSGTVGILLAYLVAAIVPRWQHNFLISAIALFTLAIILHILTKQIGKYMVPDSKIERSTDNVVAENTISTVKLFWESGFVILLGVGFIRTVVANSIKTLSATMLMESYSGISPSLGNLLNVFIIGVGVVGTVLARKVLYPKYIKSAPTGVVIMVGVSLLLSIFLIFIGKIDVSVIVIVMCLVSGCLTAAALFSTYCSLRFAKFGKSGTAAGVMNMATSVGIIVNSYGVAKLAEEFDWKTVNIAFCITLGVGLLLACIMIPLWKRFKKKYHHSSVHPVSELDAKC